MGNAGRILLFTAALCAFGASSSRGPEYTSDGQLKFPADYREWVFLSSGSGMTYGPLAAQARQGLPLFDNVFVNRESYQSFLATGHWPDKTVFVLEIRSPEGHASINNGGYFQRDLVGIEAEVKDGSAAPGTWTFYGFPLDSGKPPGSGKAFPRTASCYSCHGTNTAVENTFVQFYPVLYDVAEQKGTLKPEFQRLPLTAGKLTELVKSQGWATAERTLSDTVHRSPDAAVLSERSLNSVGHELIRSNAADAVRVLEWAAARYPQSASAQDNLADALFAAGNKDAARVASEKALALVADDPTLAADGKARLSQSARERLGRLK